MNVPLALSSATTLALFRSQRVQDARPLVARGGDERVVWRRPQERVAVLRVAGVAGRLRLPALALAADEPEQRAAVRDEDVAVDQEVFDLRHVASDRQPVLRVDREAAAVAGRRVGEDVLLGRVDDVEVVEARARVPEERPDRDDVVAPARGTRDLDGPGRAGALGVGRAPAPDDVLVVDDEQVAAAGREELRHALGRPCGLRLLAEDDGGLLRPQVDPVDRCRTSCRGRTASRPGPGSSTGCCRGSSTRRTRGSSRCRPGRRGTGDRVRRRPDRATGRASSAGRSPAWRHRRRGRHRSGAASPSPDRPRRGRPRARRPGRGPSERSARRPRPR